MQPITEQYEKTQESGGSDEKPGTPYKRLEKDGSERNNDRATSIELVFKEKKEIPPWKNQLTIRSIVVSFALGTLFGVLSMKQSLATGYLNPQGMYAAVVGYSSTKTVIMVLERCGIVSQPFTRQENTIIQTCILSACGIASYGGFRSYLFAMSSTIAKEFMPLDDDKQNIKNPSIGWMIIFLLLTSYCGSLIIVPLRKILIVDLKLAFPSGYAIGHQINSIHVPLATKFAKKQVVTFGKVFSFSFFWSFLQWLTSGGDSCGLSYLPIFGTKAMDDGFYFDFYGTYVGVGMMCPYITAVSILIGGIMSSLIVIPFLKGKSGDWYNASLSDSSFQGLTGYKIFMALSMMLGDSVYYLLKFLVIALFHKLRNKDSVLPIAGGLRQCNENLSDEQTRNQKFMNEQLPAKIAVGGYVALALISAVGLPLIIPPLKWTHVLAMYAVAPVICFCRAHVTGHTDMTPSYHFGKLVMFAFGSWVGNSPGGVLINLVVCGFIINTSSTSADTMTDLKTSHLTMSSSKSMFISRLIGTTFGCIISPVIFWYFITHYKDFGTPGSTFSTPNALSYRKHAIQGLQGLKFLPKYCLLFCLAFFIIGFLINLIRDILPKKLAKFVPIPIALALPFYMGSSNGVSMCIGKLIVFLWRWRNKTQADALVPTVASALVCGDGLWTLQQSVLFLLHTKAPLCMQIVPRLPE